jgi:hypothetical protein
MLYASTVRKLLFRVLSLESKRSLFVLYYLGLIFCNFSNSEVETAAQDPAK